MLLARLSFLLLAPAGGLVRLVRAQATQPAATLPAPGQPAQTGTVGAFVIVGNSLVSAQQIFLGTPDRVYFLDKVENNPTQINGHPAWSSEWSLGNNSQRPLDAITNTFCAGGNVLGNGTWLNVGGNQAVTFGGNPAPSQHGGAPYDDPDGRNSMRLLDPCEDASCDWVLSPQQSAQRWYPTLETLEDGSIIILGGCQNGGYVNDITQDTPTYEFFPTRGAPMASTILESTLPANLYPLTWLLPSGTLLIQSNWATSILDYKNQIETPLDDIPDAVRVYPASAGTAMLPLTPANNYTATILFCGGSDVQPNQWLSPSFIPPTFPASTSCVKLTPDVSGSYVEDDPLPAARSMANFVLLPDGRILCLNGGGLGTAGYGNNSWAIGHSYADAPVLQPAIYDPAAPNGSHWSSDGLQNSTVPRMYHSSALLLPDGSVLVSGSNPNPDYTVGPGVVYPTEYRTELFYPSYFNQRRPQPKGLLAQYSYGGPSFDITLSVDDLFGDLNNANATSVVIIRPGFSTHAINMGQRFAELNTSYTAYEGNNTAVIHVSQLPPNPAIIAPGPAFVFVVVKGVPSIGQQVMLGSGQLGTQTVLAVSDLPVASVVAAPAATSSSANTKSAGVAISPRLPACFGGAAALLALASIALWT
ncbi:copper radical oxidase [Hypholoma sublateritium FD-334 SS-4]|uniref:Copper radical oxidase n=1 Tax=Hypholoma sublateritium (strain FD-334 SS-4) TaxID=945553 RepID=A0A0D2KZY8_HYPSF|nr:copper radical oxidase [Hypholoma sublateritium FD-334 SS-4]